MTKYSWSKLLLSTLISAQIVIPQNLYAAGSSPNNSSNQTSNIDSAKKVAGMMTEEDFALMRELDAFDQRVQNGQVTQADLRMMDRWKLIDQKTTIFDQEGKVVRVVDGNEYMIKAPSTPAISKYEVKYDTEKRAVVINGIWGENDKGEFGKLAFSKELPGLTDIVAIERDAEMVIFLNKHGRVSAIDMSELAASPVRPVPVIPISISSKDLGLTEQSNIEFGFLTPGSIPFTAEDSKDALIDVGQSKFLAGSIYAKVDGRYLAYIPRTTVKATIKDAYRQMIETAITEGSDMEFLKMKLTDDQRAAMGISEEDLNEYSKFSAIKMMTDDLLAINDREQTRLSPVERRIILSLRPTDLERMFSRMTVLQKEQTKAQNNNYQFSHNQWLSDHKFIYEKALAEDAEANVDLKKMEKNWHKLVSVDPTEYESDLARWWRWQKADSETVAAAKSIGAWIGSEIDRSPVVNYVAPQLAKFNDKLSKTFRIDVKKYSQHISNNKMSILQFSLINGYMFFPEFYKAHLASRHYMVADYIQNFIMTKTEALNSPQAHIIAVACFGAILLWPIAVGISAATGEVLKRQAIKLQNSTTHSAQLLRDFARRWGANELTPWRRLTSLGMRVIGKVIYPWYKFLIIQVGNQRTIVPAIVGRVNPFQQVTPESELGQKLNLREPIRVGVNGTRLSMTEKQTQDRAHLQLKAQSLLSEQRVRHENMALIYSAVAISSMYDDVDPATILAVLKQNKIDDDTMKALESNPVKRQEWLMTADALVSEYQRISVFGIGEEIRDFSSAEQAYYANRAKEIAEKIHFSSLRSKIGRQLKIKFREKVWKVSSFLSTFAEKDIEFLSTQMSSNRTTENVRSQFVADYPLAMGMSAVVGARADTKTPEGLANLTADPNSPFFYISGKHGIDVVYQLWAYFFAATANNALVLMKRNMYPEQAGYAAKETYMYQPQSGREVPLGLSLGRWTYSVLNPLKGNIGGIFWDMFFRRLSNYQANILITMPTRLLIAKQKMGEAWAGWAVNYTTAEWGFAWFWRFVLVGNNYANDIATNDTQTLQRIEASLGQSIDSENLETAREQYASSMGSLIELYEKNNKGFYEDAQKAMTLAGLSENALKEADIKGLGIIGKIVSYNRAGKGSSEEAQALKQQLVDLYSNSTGLDRDTLQKLDAQSTLELIREHAPVYTEANSNLDMITNYIGAVLTTYLGIAFAVETTRSDLMGNWNYVATRIAGSMAIYFALKLGASKSAWLFYQDKIRLIRAAYTTGGMNAALNVDLKGSGYRAINSCEFLFSSKK